MIIANFGGFVWSRQSKLVLMYFSPPICTNWLLVSKGAFFILFSLNMLINPIMLQIWICCDFTLLLSTCICCLLNHTKTACTCFHWLLSQWKCPIIVPPLWVGKLRCWVSLKCNDYFYYKLVKSHFVSFTLLLYCRCYLMAYLWKKCQCQWQWMVLCYQSWPCTLLLQKNRWYISQYQCSLHSKRFHFFLLSSQVSRRTLAETLATQANINGS